MGKESWWKLKIRQQDIYLLWIMLFLAIARGTRDLSTYSRASVKSSEPPSVQHSVTPVAIDAPEQASDRYQAAIEKLRKIKAREEQKQQEHPLRIAGAVIFLLVVLFSILGVQKYGRSDYWLLSRRERWQVWLLLGSSTIAGILYVLGSSWWVVPALPWLLINSFLTITFFGIVLVVVVYWVKDRVKNRDSRGDRS